MQSYDSMRGYFENTLADSITNRKKFRSGLSIHDISKPAELREIAFLEMPGLGINRLWWVGGRYAYVSAHFDGFTDHILCIVDLADITLPPNRVPVVAARDESRGGRGADLTEGQAVGTAPHDHRRQPGLCGLAGRRIHRA